MCIRDRYRTCLAKQHPKKRCENLRGQNMRLILIEKPEKEGGKPIRLDLLIDGYRIQAQTGRSDTKEGEITYDDLDDINYIEVHLRHRGILGVKNDENKS